MSAEVIQATGWKAGDKIPYLALAKTFEGIEGTSSRLEITKILATFLASAIELSPQDVAPSVYLCLNRLGPLYEGLELGIAETSIIKAIAESTGRTVDRVKAEVKAMGDIGVAAQEARFSQTMLTKPAILTVPGVFQKLREIATTRSTDQKIKAVSRLLIPTRDCEARYLARCLNGKLRIGLAEQTVLTSLANAFTTTEMRKDGRRLSEGTLKEAMKEDETILKTVYSGCPNYDKIVETAIEKGIKSLPEEIKLTPGIPLQPMLAHPTKGLQEVFRRFTDTPFSCEWKYDGERCQIHKPSTGEVKLYSRNLEDHTGKYPDIINAIPKFIQESTLEFIVDAEIVAWSETDKCILPFQTLTTRKRKNVDHGEVKIKVCIFVFDLLYLNGQPLVSETYRERRRILRESFKHEHGTFMFVTCLDSNDMDEIGIFLNEAVKGKCEGLMVKTLDDHATYEIAKRSRNWLKLKKDYLDAVGDTLDLVVIGGYLGAGKRTGYYGAYLLACYDRESGEYQSICKIGTGLKDEDLRNQYKDFAKLIIEKARPDYAVDNSLAPDHWFDAAVVWEVKAADLSVSPRHRAAIGLVDESKGISLRFPRYIRARTDKGPEDATTADQIASLYREQMKQTEEDEKKSSSSKSPSLDGEVPAKKKRARPSKGSSKTSGGDGYFVA